MKKVYVITLMLQPLIVSLAGNINPRVEAEEVSFGIMPTVTQIVTESGMTAEAEVSVKNNHNQSITLRPLLQPFRAGSGENGEVQYEENEPEYFRFINILVDGRPITEMNLSPHEEKTLRVQLQVPESESSKDYYFSLILFSQPGSADQQTAGEEIHARSSISGGVASHFLVSVNPARTRTLKLTEFSAPALSQSSPVPFRVRLGNEGSHYTRVISKIEVENLLGMNIETVNVPATLILAHSTRSLNTPHSDTEKTVKSYLLPNKKDQTIYSLPTVQQKAQLFPGVYRAKLSVSADSAKYPLNRTIYFTVAPVELVLGGIIVILFLVLVRKRLTKRFKT